MAVAYDSTATANGAAVTSLTFAHTMIGSTNLGIGVGVAQQGTIRTITVTYNGESLTSQIQQTDTSDNDNAVELFAKATTSTSGNVVVTASGSCNLVAGSVGVTGCHQATPISNTAQAHDWTFTSAEASVTVTTATDELIMDALDVYTAGVTATVGAGQTQRWNVQAGGGNPCGAGSTQLGSVDGVMTWTFDVPKAWTQVAMSFKAAAAAAQQSVIVTRHLPTPTWRVG